MPEINPEHLATEIAKFRDSRRALQEIVVQCFPIGSKVRVRSTQDAGRIWSTVHGFPDLLHVQFPQYQIAPVDVLDLERFDEPY